jgi:hypothetical protein
MDTSCKLCVLAIYEGNAQVGCELDRLEKFKAAGATLELKSEDEKDYFLIKDRVCNACTQESAINDIPARKRVVEIEKRIGVRCNMAIYVGPEHFFTDATTSIFSIINQEHPPLEIKVLLHGNHNVGDYIAFMNTYAKDFDWKVEEIVLEGADFLKALDLTMKNIKSTYYTVANAGYEYRPDFLSTINKAINTDLKRFVCLMPDETGNAPLIQRGLFKMIQGNQGMPFFAKVLDIAEEEKKEYLIKRFEDL